MNLQNLLSLTRKAVDDYHMIDDGDKICVGLSGGKDSLALLMSLKALQRFYPKHFDLMAITVSVGFPDMDFTALSQFVQGLGVEFKLVETQIKDVVFDIREEENPCSLCSKMRKGALNDAAKQFGCNKIALGHNKEDVVESFLMSLLHEGRLHTFQPVTHWDRMELYAIRPIMYVHEQDIVYFANQNNLPIIKNNCPANGNTARETAKLQLIAWNKEYHGTTDRIFNAIKESLFHEIP